LPSPSKFNKIIKEFLNEFKNQKANIEDYREAKKEIQKIYLGIKDEIKKNIDDIIERDYFRRRREKIKKGLHLTK
jgi:predicted transcriptional regulator